MKIGTSTRAIRHGVSAFVVGVAAVGAAAVVGTSLGVAHSAPPTETSVGTVSCTTNASSFCVFPHELDGTPTSVIVTVRSPSTGPNIAANANADFFNNTTVRVRIFSPTGGAYANRPAVFSFAAYLTAPAD